MVRIGHGARLAEGERIVSISRIPELRNWTHDPQRGLVTVGSAVPWSELASDTFAALVPALGQAARTVGSPQIRNAGTLGGNVATASPAGDGLCALVALNAVAEIRSTSGSRQVSVSALITGPKKTSLEHGELITAFQIPTSTGFQGYAKVGVRNAMVISIAGVCLVVNPATASVRIALGSVGPTILRCPEAEDLVAAMLVEGKGSQAALTAAANAAMRCSQPIDDHRSSAEYRRHAIGVLTQRLAQRALDHHKDGTL